MFLTVLLYKEFQMKKSPWISAVVVNMRRCGSPLAPRLYVYDLPQRYREDPREAVGLGTALAGVAPLEHMPEGVQLWHTAEVCRLTHRCTRPD